MTIKLSPSSPQINATVMASAGTGKTYMLVNRLVRLLLRGAKPDAILAITFTRKAAAEMQSRLTERLLAMASADSDQLAELLRELGETPEPATMGLARRLYESLLQSRSSVRTTTFHAFCQEILLRFPLEADVPPGFELLDSASELLEDARNALLTQASNHPDGDLAQALQHLLDYCGSLDGMQRALCSFIDHRGDWWAYTEEAEDAVTFALERLQSDLQVTPERDPLEHFFTEERCEQLVQFAELLAKHPNKGNTEALQAIAHARDTALPYELRFEACRSVFLTQKNAPRSRKASKAQAKSMGIEGEAQFLTLHDQLSQAVLATLDEQLAVTCWYACAAWYRAGTELLHHFQQLKLEQRLLDFTDLEWRAYRLLNHADNALWVQYKLDQRIDHLLVDEFQDTNPTQWRLLLPLLQEMAAGNDERTRSVFLVGDAKQSIYRFRRAEPRLFQAAHDWLEEHLGAGAFPLHISWRSAQPIMQCVNNVFDEHGPLAGRLRDFTQHDTHHREMWGKVTVLPLIEEESTPDKGAEDDIPPLRNPLETARVIEQDDNYQREGTQIAETIQQLIASGQVVGRGDNAHPIHYGDIMILLRKRTHSGYYEAALRDAAIPYIGAERGTLLQSIEVSDMVALLEVLVTPYNNLSLATVLRSPLFDCSNRDLITLATSGSGGWYQRLRTVADTLDENHPLAVAATLMERWRQLAGKVPIHDLLDRIFDEGNVLARYRAAFPEHLVSRVSANLTRFLELALEIDSGRYPSLGHFLTRLGEMRDNSDEAPDEAPEAGNAERVRLLTIHASKGLEAPVIFLADSASGDSPDKAYRTLLHWPPQAPRPERFMLLGKKEQHPEMVRLQLEQEQDEAARESANLLYVALTRARQALFVSGVKPKRGQELGWYGTVRHALDPLETVPLDQPYNLETGHPPELPRRQTAPLFETKTAVDPRLSQPLTLAPRFIEVAPSYQDAANTLVSHGGDEDGRLRGIVIHRMLQEMTENRPDSWSSISNRIAAEFSLTPEAREYKNWYRECHELITDEALSAVFSLGNGVSELNEVPMVYRLNDRIVHGIIDRLLIQQEEVWVIDYKTHAYADTSNYPDLASHYSEQLGYYVTGAGQLWPERRIRAFILFTRPHLLYELPPVTQQ